MKIHLITFIFSLVAVFSFGQSVEIKPGNILPKMTTAQRTSFATPVNGMLVFDSNTQSYWFRQTGAWVELPKGGSTNNYWQLTGNVIKNTNSGGFWSANPMLVPISAENSTHPPAAPISGAGTRLMWIPSRSAFRVGTVENKHWDADSVGIFSFASGINTIAKGKYSTAMGLQASALDDGGVSLGLYTTSSHVGAVALGLATNAAGYASTAIGHTTTAKGWYATAIGHKVEARGRGSFIIGDYVDSPSEEIRVQTTENRFTARFRGGYYVMTSGNSGTITGVQMGPGANSWGTISDSTKKEKFIAANSQEILNSVSKIRVGTWNYIGQDPTSHRHWGIMAQDFYKHFGKDKYGTIGNDTTIATADFDGVAFAAIKGLEERTRVLSEKLTVNSEHLSEQLKTKSEKLERENSELKDEIATLKVQNDRLSIELSKLRDNALEWNLQLAALLKEFSTIKNQNSVVSK